jgi:hypothetical protein
MGLWGSKVTDKVLAEKMRRQEDALGDEEEQEIRRKNSMVLAIEDYLEGKANQVPPEPVEEKKVGGPCMPRPRDCLPYPLT